MISTPGNLVNGCPPKDKAAFVEAVAGSPHLVEIAAHDGSYKGWLTKAPVGLYYMIVKGKQTQVRVTEKRRYLAE